jgi:hypothetical protein
MSLRFRWNPGSRPPGSRPQLAAARRPLAPSHRLTHHTGTNRPASTAARPHQCGGLPHCGDFTYVYDAQTSAKRKSSALFASTDTPAKPRRRTRARYHPYAPSAGPASPPGSIPAPNARVSATYHPRQPASESPTRRIPGQDGSCRSTTMFAPASSPSRPEWPLAAMRSQITTSQRRVCRERGPSPKNAISQIPPRTATQGGSCLRGWASCPCTHSG